MAADGRRPVTAGPGRGAEPGASSPTHDAEPAAGTEPGPSARPAGAAAGLPRPGLGRMLARGLLRRCPRCGARGVFARWFRLCDRCPGCGYRFEREEGFFLGAFVINFGVTQGALIAFIAVSLALTLPDPPTVALLAGGVAVGLLVPLAFYPSSRTLWAAIDLGMRPLEPDEEREASRAAGADVCQPAPKGDR